MKLKFLDGLRGLAALIVVIDHFAISFFPAATDANARATHGALESVVQDTPAHLLVAGNYSVCIFFVLSGIVLSVKFFRTGDQQVVWASAVKRYFRLGLPVLACVLIAWLFLVTGAFFNDQAATLTGSDWLGRFWHSTPSLWAALSHALYGVFTSGQSDYNTVLWTMKTELIGSFLVFGILLVFGKWRYRGIAYLILSILLIKTYYVPFVWGVALCDYYQRGETSLTKLLTRGGWLPLAAVSLFLGSCPVNSLRGTAFAAFEHILPWGMSFQTTVHIVGAFGLVAAVMYTPILQRLLSRGPLLYLGKVSFGLYLTHLLVLGTLGTYIFTKLAPAMDYRLAFGLMIIPTGLTIWLVAHVFSRYVDASAIRVSGKVYQKVRPIIAKRRSDTSPGAAHAAPGSAT